MLLRGAPRCGLLAGHAGGAGSFDGTGASARFDYPVGVASDSSGNLYVGDAHNYTLRKVSPAGVTSTLAGAVGLSGSADGAGTAARFLSLSGLAVDTSGNVYVADAANHTIRKVSPTGVVSTLAGTAGASGSADGTGAAARFYYPAGLAVDSSGNVFVADSVNHTLRKITPAGAVSTVVGQAGSPSFAPGDLPGALSYPRGLALQGRTLYIATNNAVVKVTDLP